MRAYLIMDMNKDQIYGGPYAGNRPSGYHLIFRNKTDGDVIELIYHKNEAQKFLENFYKQFPRLNIKK
jgi:hypothetical protein